MEAVDRFISMAEIRSKLANFIGQVAYGGERIILKRRGQPIAVLIGVDEYRRLRQLEPPVLRPPLPPELRQRQERLIAHAQQLRARLGDPIEGLGEIMSTLPPESDEFWLQLATEMP